MPIQRIPTGVGSVGNSRAQQKGSSDKTRARTKRWIPIDPVSGPEKGRRAKTGGQPQKSKLIRGSSPLQNGRYPYPQKLGGKRGLASEDRSQGCILFHSDRSGTQEIPVLPVRRTDLPIQLPPIWANVSTVGLYQDPETSNGSRTRAGDETGGVYRRYPVNGGDQGQSPRASRRSDFSASVPGVHNKHRKDGERTVTNYTISRFHTRHEINGAESPGREDKKDSGGVSKAVGGGADNRPRPLEADRENERCQPSDSTSATVLQALTDGPSSSAEDFRARLRNCPLTLARKQGRAKLVGHRDGQMERKDCPVDGARHGDRIRRIEPGMGSVLPGHEHRWSMVGGGIPLAHKLPGTTSGYASAQNVRKEQERSVDPAENRQLNGSSLHQQPRWDGIQEPGISDPEIVDVVPRKKHSYPGSAPARSTELCSRQRIEMHEGQVGLEVRQPILYKDQQSVWPTGSGPICVKTNQSVPSLLQLAARSVRRSSRRISPGLVDNTGFCQSSMEPGTQGSGESEGTGSGPCPGSPCVESTTMVRTATIHDSGLATPTSEAGNQSTVRSEPSVSRVEHLRKSFDSQGLSVQATELVLQSWRTKTNKSYDSLFRKWNRWCIERGSNPISGPVSEVANFLAALYQKGYQYNSINAYRSAISSVHEKMDGVPVGQHPLVNRLVKGVFNARPPIPRYSSTWDVQIVLNYLESLGNNDTLSLKQLTLKTAFLMAITRPSRTADLSQLDTARLRNNITGVAFLPSVLAKQSRQGRSIVEFFFPLFPDNPALCPVKAIRAYLDRTESLRGTEVKMFLSYIKPHKAITSSTIARWLKSMLEQAGVNPDIFGAHSTRGASASAAARGGITTEDILKAANWSSESVFQKFYHREIDKGAYGRAVINSSTQNSSE